MGEFLNFPRPGRILISPIILKGILTEYRNHSVKLFSLGTCNMFLCTFPASVIFNEMHFPPLCSATAKSIQSCPILCDPIDGSPSGSPVPGILRARTLEWVAISSSNAWKWKVKVKSLSRIRLLATSWTAAYQAPPSTDSPGKSTGVGCHCLLLFCY